MSLSNNVYVFSGFRDDTLKAQIEANGGKVAVTLVKNATHVIIKRMASLEKPNKLVAEAKEKELEFLLLDIFMGENNFTAGEKKLVEKPKDNNDAHIVILSKILKALATGEGKKDALKFLDILKEYLSA